jgi:hypothetical protein
MLGDYPFKGAEKTWRSFQKNLTKFINSHSGKAVEGPKDAFRMSWDKAKSIYFK